MKSKLHKIKKVASKVRPQRKKVDSPEYIEKAAENAPRITNETVAVHREEVLSTARKYIMPLQHSKHQVVKITTTLFIMVIIGFFVYCVVALYKLQSSSTFIYRVTQVIPFPIAKAGDNYVAYENYLFELRRYTHYFNNQQNTDFDDPTQREQLTQFKKMAKEKVVRDAYVKQLASQYKVSVNDKELDEQIALVRDQNRLGGSTKVFEDVLKDYWGWSVADFRRSLRQQVLAQKLAERLEETAKTQADAAMTELKAGGDFAAIAKKYSTDNDTKERGGEFGFPIDRNSRSITPQTTEALFALKPGEYSAIITVPNGLEIVKNIETNGQRIRAAHIFFKFEDIERYIKELQDKKKPQLYI